MLACLGAFALGFWLGHGARLPSTGDGASAPAAGSDSVDAAVKRHQVPVTLSQPSRGPTDALVTIVQWCDFERPACLKLDAALESLRVRYEGDVRVVFRHFAEPSATAQLPHEFAQLAFEQAGKFWEAKALVSSGARPLGPADFEPHAKQLGLDWTSVRSALERHTHAGHVASDRAFAALFGVQDVPAVFVNGRRIEGEVSPRSLRILVEDERERARGLVARGVSKAQLYAELTKDGAWDPQARMGR
jgi:protein-disulfide isomerase